MSIFKIPVSVCHALEMIRARFFWGGDIDERKISWVKWDLALNDKDKGGLGIGSLAALNKALLYKWKLRFCLNTNALWANLIKACHGDTGGLFNQQSLSRGGVWKAIVGSINHLHENGLVYDSMLVKRLGNGRNTNFWTDMRHGSIAFKHRLNRLYALSLDQSTVVRHYWNGNAWSFNWRRPIRGGAEEEQYTNLISELSLVTCSDTPDSWSWELDASGLFTVKSLRQQADSVALPCGAMSINWVCFVPKKVNVLIWRLALNRLPTRDNLDRKGIELGSTLCLFCDANVETANHVFFTCGLASQVLNVIGLWMDISPLFLENIVDLYQRIDSSGLPVAKREIMMSISYTTIGCFGLTGMTLRFRLRSIGRTPL